MHFAPDRDALAANLELLEGLLTTLTGVLDIRGVFDRVSEIAGRVLAHDAMSLPILTEDRELGPGSPMVSPIPRVWIGFD